MSVQTGDTIPSVTLRVLGADGPEDVDTGALFAGRKVVLFSVPGAFTPTCSTRHLPGFVDSADAIKAKGVDLIVCLSVNDMFVMKAWGEANGVAGKVMMLPDGSALFTKALGLTQDMTERGMGVRGRRFALIADHGRISHLAVEESGQFGVSSATAILGVL